MRDTSDTFPDNYVSKEWLPRSRKRRSWVVKLARGCEEIYISKGQRKVLQFKVF